MDSDSTVLLCILFSMLVPLAWIRGLLWWYDHRGSRRAGKPSHPAP
jgi:hypothetical protein